MGWGDKGYLWETVIRYFPPLCSLGLRWILDGMCQMLLATVIECRLWVDAVRWMDYGRVEQRYRQEDTEPLQQREYGAPFN